MTEDEYNAAKAARRTAHWDARKSNPMMTTGDTMDLIAKLRADLKQLEREYERTKP